MEAESEIFFGKCENLFWGNVPDDLIILSYLLTPTEKAWEWHDYVQKEIRKLGYETRREVFVYIGNGKTGRLDLVAKKDGIEIAIELDYRVPRKKSVLKIKTYKIGMVLLRDPKIIKKIRIKKG